MSEHEERRYCPRRAVSISARLRILGLGRDIDRMQLSPVAEVTIRDIGLNGVSVDLPKVVVGGLSLDRLDLRAEKPVLFLQWDWPDGSGRARVSAEAVHLSQDQQLNSFRAGLRWTGMNKEDLATLRTFVEG
jgi:PilZ domain